MLAASLAVAVLPIYGLGRRGRDESHVQQKPDLTNSLPYPGHVVEEIVARVDDQVIDSSDYKRAESDLEQEAKQNNWTPEELARQKKNLLRNLIDNQLLLAKGKQLGISGEDELIHRLDQIRKQNGMKSMQALQQAVESQGLSWQDFQQQIKQNIVREGVIRQEVDPTIRINPGEVKAYYEQHKAEYKHPEQVKLSEILIPTANSNNAAQVAAAKAKADAIEKQLAGGADFAKLAKTDSKGPNASKGGDLGAFTKGQLAPELEQDTFSLKTGQYTKPIQTQQGWIILEVTQHQDAGVAPMSQVQNQIMQTIGMSKMPQALRQYLTKLRTQAYIDIRPGYTDTGATKNEIKPTYSAYLPPTQKKKKVFHSKRRRFTSKRELAKRERERKKEGTQKLGKREKIRFGQAPREALPPALNQTDLNNAGGQAAANNAAEAAMSDQNSQIEKPKKVRYSSIAEKREKKKRDARAAKKESRKKMLHPVPVVGKEAQASQAVQESSLGLGGVTKKTKKAHPMRQGPKRRYSKVQEQKKQGQGSSGTGSDSSTGSDSGTGSSNTQQ